MRVLSPRMEPPVRMLEGSTAVTASFRPSSTSIMPRASMRVLLPAPGTPVMPTRMAPPAWGRMRVRSSWACSKCAGALDSMSVMALASMTRSPARTPAASSSTGMVLRRWWWDMGTTTRRLPGMPSWPPFTPGMTWSAWLGSSGLGTFMGPLHSMVAAPPAGHTGRTARRFRPRPRHRRG